MDFFKPIIKDLVLLSICGIADFPRIGVKDSIECCKRAGVTVRMITGDNLETGVAIARDVGILTPEEISKIKI